MSDARDARDKFHTCLLAILINPLCFGIKLYEARDHSGVSAQIKCSDINRF